MISLPLGLKAKGVENAFTLTKRLWQRKDTMSCFQNPHISEIGIYGAVCPGRPGRR